MKHRVCECAETRRNLERENKPGGVKIGVRQFITVSLFCMLISPLWANCNSNTPQEDCNCTGWYWEIDTEDSNSGECTNCGENKYYANNACSNCIPPYPKAKAGASSADHCYREIACAGENDAAPGNINARLYANGCIEYGGNDNGCFEAISSNSQNWSSHYHMEGTGNDAQCYSNNRACHLFNYRKASEETSVSPSASNNTNVIITGTARWYTSYWNVNDCYKKENNENISGAHCTGVTIAQASNDNNNVNNVTNVNGVLVYYDSPQLQNNNSNCPSCWQYRCTSCPAGYRPDSGIQGQYNSCPRSDNVVCSCAETVQGYYSTGGPFCNYTFDGSIFSTNNFVNNFCSPSSESYVHPCSKPGMTSDGGATSDDECHYGSGGAGTQFCDAFGCVYLDNLTFNDNGYSWTGDVHLVGVLFEENGNYKCPDATPTPRYFWGYDKDGNPIDTQGDIVDNCRRN
ncbi:MAG: hypothetical protein K6B71_02430 [Alphaproteobacteria bacterium]|nr:hypothetical protein [Alphaproteobacteria bacterium]